MKVKVNVWAPAVILFLPGLLQIVEGVAHSENKNSLNAFIFWKIDSKPSTCTWFVCCNDTLCPTIQNICYRQPDDEVSNHNSESIWKYCSLRMRLSIKKSESIWKYFLQPEDIVINRKSRVGESVESALSALTAIFFWLVAGILTIFDKKYCIWTCYDKRESYLTVLQ